MASTRSSARVGAGARTSSSRGPVVEEIVPSSGWTEDSAGHYLLVDLPEFKKEEVKLQIDSYGRIIVKGERHPNERKRVRFHLTFPVPVDSDTDKVAGRFDAGILYVTVPKVNKESEAVKAANGTVERAEENKRQEQAANGNAEREEQHERQEPIVDDDNVGRDRIQEDSNREKEVKRIENAQIGEFSEGMLRKWEHEPMVRSVVEVFRKNKGIVITAVIAFSLGILISRKFQSSAPS
ncbi:hypothetical protein HN51_003302 [Arachis hypogaea]|uniref:SHSP domain-containing protein n=1 Tax=Arachis hypogaea TaxID=3818 RepID=A0A445EJB3_ARAHY|nr:uncharacterized protein LOC112710554 [Arachis hypogaea]QHO51664.1 Inactive protein RESTRICTED TEV MOVEMENT [Arachis hypogaea]RYR75504.1 hypothetical protein Ahy_A01g000047 [Arachis hypogaea]